VVPDKTRSEASSQTLRQVLSAGDLVARAGRWYAEIERSAASLRVDTLTLDELSSDGGRLVIHRRQDEIVKITSFHRWHRGQQQLRIYLSAGEPFFVLDVSDRQRSRARGDRERREDRWYLGGDSVIRWLDASKAVRDLRSPEAIARAAALRQSVWRVLDVARRSPVTR